MLTLARSHGYVKVVSYAVTLLICVAGRAHESHERNSGEGGASAILGSATKSQSSLRSLAVRIDLQTDFLHRPSFAPEFIKRITKEISSLEVRIDADRQDVREESWNVRSDSPKLLPQYKTRAIWDGHQQIQWQQYQPAGPKSLQPSVSSHFTELVRTRDFCGLLGFAWGDQKSMIEILRDSKTASLGAGMENIGKSTCYVVQAKTSTGSYRIWIDPAAGYQVRRAVVSRKPDDIWFGKSLPAEGGESTIIGVEIEIHDVAIEKIANQWVTTGCITDARFVYPNGEYEQTRTTARCSAYQLNPDFKKSAAFVMDDIPDGTPVAIMDGERGAQNGVGIWHDGQVTQRQMPGPEPAHPQIGQEAPHTTGKDVNGDSLSLSDFRGRIVVLVFWGPWCGPCMAKVPAERALLKSMKDKPFALVGVADDQTLDSIKAAIQKEQIAWPNFFDGRGGPIEKLWGIHRWPTVYVIDAKGIIRDADPHDMDESVRRLLAETR